MGKRSKKPALIEECYRSDGRNCYYCRRELMPLPLPVYPDGRFPPDYPTLDHVIPQSLGGQLKITNVVVSCKQCNARKGDRPFAAVAPRKIGTKPRRPEREKRPCLKRHPASDEFEAMGLFAIECMEWHGHKGPHGVDIRDGLGARSVTWRDK